MCFIETRKFWCDELSYYWPSDGDEGGFEIVTSENVRMREGERGMRWK